MIPWRRLSFGRNFTAHHFARYYLLRALPFPSVRNFVAWMIGRTVAARNPGPSRAQSGEEVRSTVARLRDSGFSMITPAFSSEQIDDILRYLATQPAFDRDREFFVTDDTNDALRGQYSAATILQCPHILAAINNPTVLSVAEKFLGCKPTIAALGLHWSFPTDETPADVQTFHRDQEAWRLLNMFVYLTDVGVGHGPHRYVLNSQGTNGRVRLSPYSDAEVFERFGKDRVHTVVGPRGTTFVENGWGVHEGHPPRDGRRLLLAVMYSVGPIPVYDYPAIRLTGEHDYDKFVNRLLISGTAPQSHESREPANA